MSERPMGQYSIRQPIYNTQFQQTAATQGAPPRFQYNQMYEGARFPMQTPATAAAAYYDPQHYATAYPQPYAAPFTLYGNFSTATPNTNWTPPTSVPLQPTLMPNAIAQPRFPTEPSHSIMQTQSLQPTSNAHTTTQIGQNTSTYVRRERKPLAIVNPSTNQPINGNIAASSTATATSSTTNTVESITRNTATPLSSSQTSATSTSTSTTTITASKAIIIQTNNSTTTTVANTTNTDTKTKQEIQQTFALEVLRKKTESDKIKESSPAPISVLDKKADEQIQLQNVSTQENQNIKSMLMFLLLFFLLFSFIIF
jgi:hypothetical protein